ncbi:MAG: VOC family protein [Saprospiraceae bacterium]
MTTINVYLTFNGNCETAFNYYRSVFGGEFASVNRFGGMPLADGHQISPEEQNRIMHISLPISNETILMGSDTVGEGAANFLVGNNFAISIRTNSKKEADQLFDQLSAGGRVTLPMDQTFWGDYFGMLTDQFGINWMISFTPGAQG